MDTAWLESQGLDSRVAEPVAGRRLGDYELYEELGRGAMGVVYRARQVSLDRWVAVKLLLAGPLASPEAVERFQVEATAAGVVQHPGIVAIHDVGVEEGQHYLVMDYVAGASLAKILAGGPLSPRRAARYVQAVAEAVQAAHEHGVLHRDLKPSNVLVDAADQPHVTDFGVAKRLGTDSSLTLSGEVVGSPGYLSPEQADAAKGPVGRTSDVYSLGAMLFHLLTGRPPFVGENAAEVIRQVVEHEAVSPRLLNPAVPRDLETLCLKCLQKEPGRRYATARELAEELGRYLAGEPIQARPLGWAGRTWSWCRRRPAQASLAGALVAAVVVGLAGVLWQWGRARATAAREVAERERAERLVYRLQIQTAEGLFDHGNAAAGLAVLADRLRQDPADRPVAEWVLAELAYRNWPVPAIEPLAHSEPVHYAEFSPDGRRILTAALDNTARLWDAATGRLIGRAMEHDRRAVLPREDFLGGQKCLQAHFSPDGSRIVTASVDNTARIWDGHTGEPLTPSLRHPDWVTCAQFSLDGRWVATGCRDGGVRLWNVQTGEPTGTVLRHDKYVNFLTFAPDGRRLLTGSEDMTAQVWEPLAGRSVGQRLQHAGWVRAGQFSPDGERLATASADGTARIWKAATGEPLSPPLQHDKAVGDVQFSPDGNWLATASFDQTVRLWDAANGAARSRPLEHGGTVRSIQFSADGRRLLSAAEDKTVRIWDVRTGQLLMEPIRHAAQVWSARFSSDGQRVVTASSDRTCGVWDVRPGAVLPAELPPPGEVRQARWSPDGRRLIARNRRPCLFTRSVDWALVANLWGDRDSDVAEFSPDGRWIVTGSQDGVVRIWDAQSGEGLRRVRHRGTVVSACFSQEGRRLLTASADRTAVVWDSQSGLPLLTLPHPVPLRLAEFDSEANRILSVGTDDRVRVWRVADGRMLAAWQAHTGEVTEAHFSPEGTRVVTGSRDFTARIWEAATGRPLTGPLSHRGEVLSVRFSPDGQRVLAASLDNTAALWSITDGRLESVLHHEAAVYSARFSPDGRRVVTASEDRTARCWDTATGQPLGSPRLLDDRVRDAAFSPDGKWLAVAGGHSVWVWPVPRCDAAVPERLAALAEAMGGLRQVAALSSEAVPPVTFLDLRRRLAATTPDSEAGVWLAWLVADRSLRTVAPGAALSLPELVTREETNALWGFVAGANVIEQLLALHPDEGWLWAQAARHPMAHFERLHDAQRLREAEWLEGRALALAPDHPAVWWTQASIRFNAGDQAGTLQAIERAEGLPGASTRLSLARAQWLEHYGQSESSLAAYSRAIEGREASPKLGAEELRLAWLACSGLHAQLGNARAARTAHNRAYDLNLQPRDPTAPSRLIDLTDFFTANLDDDWRADGFRRHTLAALPRGRQVFAGVEYDVRGLIQLSSTLLDRRFLWYPPDVVGIPVRQLCRQIHFLHAADCAAPAGVPLAAYTIRWVDGQEDTIAIHYGQEASSWDGNPVVDHPRGTVAWRGTNPAGEPVCLFRTSWTNAHPDLVVATIILASSMTDCAPFVVAITAE